jgi:hypothetical protein
MIARRCPTHGDVIPIRRQCPWGCDHEFGEVEHRDPPAVDWRIELPALMAAGVLAPGDQS